MTEEITEGIEGKNLHVMSIKGGGYANLTAVDVTMGEDVVEVGGKNKNGKSNLLQLVKILSDSSKEALGAKPLNVDAEKGKFIIKIGDTDKVVRYVVSYSFTESNTYVKIKDADDNDVKVTDFRKMLNPCIEPYDFYELATAEGNGATERQRKAVNMLKPLMKFDFDAEAVVETLGFTEDMHVKSLMSQHQDDPIAFLEAFIDHISTNRLDWKNKRDAIKGSIKTLQEEVPPESRDMEEEDGNFIFEEQKRLQGIITANEVNIQKGVAFENAIKSLENQVEAKKAEFAAFREEVGDITSDLEAVEDLEILKIKAENATEHNALARKATDLRAKKIELDESEEKIEYRDDLIEKIRSIKSKTIDNAEMPIEGLSIKGTTILKNGLPLGSDSRAEGLEDAFKIALAKFAQMPDSKDRLMTMVINDASLMDDDTKSTMYELARKYRIQVIVELVMSEPHKGIIFVDNGKAVNVDA